MSQTETARSGSGCFQMPRPYVGGKSSSLEGGPRPESRAVSPAQLPTFQDRHRPPPWRGALPTRATPGQRLGQDARAPCSSPSEGASELFCVKTLPLQRLKPPELFGDSLLKFTYFRDLTDILSKCIYFQNFFFKPLSPRAGVLGCNKILPHLLHLPPLQHWAWQAAVGTMAPVLDPEMRMGASSVIGR